MQIDADKLMFETLRDVMREAVKARLSSSYSNPFNDLFQMVIDANSGSLRSMLDDAIKSCVNETAFREEIAEGVRRSLAKTLIARFGGEMERQVNALKSDPTTRARITLAIDEIIKERAAANV